MIGWVSRHRVSQGEQQAAVAKMSNAEADWLAASTEDSLAGLSPPPEEELRALGLVSDCEECGGRIVQRAFGPRRVTCSGACRSRLSRARRRIRPLARP
jgi:hypothetical protein